MVDSVVGSQWDLSHGAAMVARPLAFVPMLYLIAKMVTITIVTLPESGLSQVSTTTFSNTILSREMMGCLAHQSSVDYPVGC